MARSELAATSLRNMAIFAGGTMAGELEMIVALMPGNAFALFFVASLIRVFCYVLHPHVVNPGGGYSDDVDLYDSTLATWSTARLSVARGSLAAASVGNVALFSGGRTNGDRSTAVDLFNVKTRSWSTAQLSLARSAIAAASVSNVAIFSGGLTSMLFMVAFVLLFFCHCCGSSLISPEIARPV
jgi:hypothetical protein